MTVQLRVFDEDLTTLIATLDQPYDISWLDERLGVGGGKFTIPHDSPIVQANPGILSPDHLVKVRVDGTDRFAWLMRRPSRGHGETWDPVTVAGPGITDILRTGVVYPAGGLDQPLLSDQRVFGWMSIDFDTTGWLDGDTLASLGAQGGGGLPANFVGNPPDWPDPDAEWIWTEDPSGDGTVIPYTHPPGTCYFRRNLEIDGEPVGGPARIYVSGVNAWTAYFDAREIGSGGGHRELRTFDVEMVDGVDHVIAFKVTNARRSGTWTGQNIGGLLVTIRRLDADGEPGSVFYRSYVNGFPFPLAGREPSWRGLGYPASVPGVTIGYILRTLFDEAQDRGALDALTCDFTDTVDSDGVPWDDEIEFVCQVGNDNILSVAERLRQYRIDFEVTPGLVFRCWQDRGADRGATPDTATVTVPLAAVRERQVRDGEWETFGSLLVRSADTWLQRPDPGPSAARREAFLSLGLTPSAGSAARIGDETLTDYAAGLLVPSWRTSSSQPSVPAPYDDYFLADIIRGPWLATIAGAWALADVRVDSITGEFDETGDIDWTVEVSLP